MLEQILIKIAWAVKVSDVIFNSLRHFSVLFNFITQNQENNNV